MHPIESVLHFILDHIAGTSGLPQAERAHEMKSLVTKEFAGFRPEPGPAEHSGMADGVAGSAARVESDPSLAGSGAQAGETIEIPVNHPEPLSMGTGTYDAGKVSTHEPAVEEAPLIRE